MVCLDILFSTNSLLALSGYHHDIIRTLLIDWTTSTVIGIDSDLKLCKLIHDFYWWCAIGISWIVDVLNTCGWRWHRSLCCVYLKGYLQRLVYGKYEYLEQVLRARNRQTTGENNGVHLGGEIKRRKMCCFSLDLACQKSTNLLTITVFLNNSHFLLYSSLMVHNSTTHSPHITIANDVSQSVFSQLAIPANTYNTAFAKNINNIPLDPSDTG